MTREQKTIEGIKAIMVGYEVFTVPKTLEELISDIEMQIRYYHVNKEYDKYEAIRKQREESEIALKEAKSA